MEIVEPIRDPKKIAAFKQYLLGGKNIRNYALVVFGLNSALRITDILKLRWEAVYDFAGDEFRTHVYLREMKTEKSKILMLNNSAIKALVLLKDSIDCGPKDYIFKSREGVNRHITRIMALKIVKDAAEAVGIRERIGCHSLRKTFGYHSWKKGVPLPLLCELFNHSTQQVTKRYLGIMQDDLDSVYRLVEL